jgi:hypothetical protein
MDSMTPRKALVVATVIAPIVASCGAAAPIPGTAARSELRRRLEEGGTLYVDGAGCAAWRVHPQGLVVKGEIVAPEHDAKGLTQYFRFRIEQDVVTIHGPSKVSTHQATRPSPDGWGTIAEGSCEESAVSLQPEADGSLAFGRWRLALDEESCRRRPRWRGAHVRCAAHPQDVER